MGVPDDPDLYRVQVIPVVYRDIPSGRLRYMMSYMISRNYDIAYDIICLEVSMIS